MRSNWIAGVVLAVAVAIAGSGAIAAWADGPLAPRLKVGPNRPVQMGRLQPKLLRADGSGSSFSYNWSGYAAGNGSELFNSVSSTFTQPAVTCPVAGAYTVFWVGLDGWYNDTVEQDGTLAYCAGTTPEYSMWWEMYPSNYIQWTLPISAGDVINASVKFAKGKYTLAVKDKTAKSHFTTKQMCAVELTCQRNTAEWIVERPGYGGYNFAPLANWGTTALSGDKAAAGGKALTVAAFPNFGIDMVNNGFEYELATVGALSPKGTVFADTWDATS